MGLLGNGFDDPQSAAIMALAGGLLQGNFGGGLLGANQAFTESKRNAQAQQLAQMQLQQHQLALEKAKRDAANEQGLAGLQPQFFRNGTQGQGGTAAVNAALPPEMQIGAQPAIPARTPQFDVKGYTGEALSKGYMTPLQAIQLQQAFAKDNQINKLDVKDFTPASVQKFQQTGNYGDLQRMDKLHFADTGGNIAGLDPFTGKPVNAVAKTGNPFSDLLLSDGNGGMTQNSPLIGAKMAISKAGAPSMTAITNVKNFEPFANKVQGEMGTKLVSTFDTLQNVPQTIQALEAAKANLAKAGTFVGSGAEQKLALAKFFNNNFGTSIDPSGVKNAEALQSALFYNVMDNLKKMDASPSQQQQKYMQDAFGRLTTDPAALPMIIDFYKNQVTSKVAEHNRRVKQAQTGPAALQFPYDISIKMPEGSAPTAPTGVTADYVWRNGKLVPAGQ